MTSGQVINYIFLLQLLRQPILRAVALVDLLALRKRLPQRVEEEELIKEMEPHSDVTR